MEEKKEVKVMEEEKVVKKNKEEKIKKRKERELKVKKGLGGFFNDFKKFIAKGNIVDLAVAVVIGSAFNKIVSSLVNDIIMPLISLAVGGASVKDWKWVIKDAVYDSAGNLVTAESALSYGVFIQAIIDFLIISFTIFIVLKILVNSQRGMKGLSKKLKKEIKRGNITLEEAHAQSEKPVAPPVKIESEQDILKDIRALLEVQTGKTAEEISEEKVIKKEENKNES